MSKLKLSLVENAFDFFLEAIKHLDESYPKKLKYATLHMSSAVELILKARLAEGHWALIFKDPSSKLMLKSLKRVTSNLQNSKDAQDRLENICDLDLSKHKAILKTLRDMRIGYSILLSQERLQKSVLYY